MRAFSNTIRLLEKWPASHIANEMNKRTLLRSQLIQAWRTAIDTDYKRQRINSERSLQASIWSELNKIFGDQPRRMFIEPGIVIVNTNTDEQQRTVRVPDLVICNSTEIIGVMEIKYGPRVKPSYKKDLETLTWIAQHGSEIAIANYRFRGNIVDAHAYKMSKSVVFAWAGVHRDEDFSLPIPESIKENFLALHAVTRKDGDPEIRVSQ